MSGNGCKGCWMFCKLVLPMIEGKNKPLIDVARCCEEKAWSSLQQLTLFDSLTR